MLLINKREFSFPFFCIKTQHSRSTRYKSRGQDLTKRYARNKQFNTIFFSCKLFWILHGRHMINKLTVKSKLYHKEVKATQSAISKLVVFANSVIYKVYLFQGEPC